MMKEGKEKKLKEKKKKKKKKENERKKEPFKMWSPSIIIMLNPSSDCP